jgi:hypothetical protein
LIWEFWGDTQEPISPNWVVIHTHRRDEIANSKLRDERVQRVREPEGEENHHRNSNTRNPLFKRYPSIHEGGRCALCRQDIEHLPLYNAHVSLYIETFRSRTNHRGSASTELLQWTTTDSVSCNITQDVHDLDSNM